MSFNNFDREQLRRIERKVDQLLKQGALFEGTKAMPLMDDVLTAVAAETTVEDSVITLLDRLAAMITAADADPAKLDALVATIGDNKQAIADAVAANTA